MENNNLLLRLDNLNWSPYLIKLISLLGLGLFFEYYDIFLTAYIAPSLLKSHIFNANMHGFMGLNDIAIFVSSMFLGMWCGTLILGYVSDKYGRKTIFTWSLICYSLCTLIMAFQTSKMGFNFWRFLASVGIGIEMVNITSYISEIVPGKYRGRASAFAMVIAFLSVPTVALLAWALSEHIYFGIEGFRVIIIIGSLGAIAVWFIRLGLPESPRWLYLKGRHNEAVAIIEFMEQKTNTAKPLIMEHADVLQKQLKKYSDIFKPPLIKTTIVLMIFHILQTIGYFGFATWVPILLLAKGITITKSLKYSFIIAIANPVAPIIYTFIADKMERKMQIVCISILIALFGILFALQSSNLWIIICGICLTLSLNIFSCAFLLYQTELYPTDIRSSAVGFVYSWSRFSAIFSSFVIVFIIDHYNVVVLFTFIASCMIIIAILIFLFGNKTNNIMLEKIKY